MPNKIINTEFGQDKPIEATIKAIPPSQKIKIFDKPQFEVFFKDTGEYVNIPTLLFLGVFDRYRLENADHIFTIPSLTRAYRNKKALEGKCRKYSVSLTDAQVSQTESILNQLKGREIIITTSYTNEKGEIENIEFVGEALNYDTIKSVVNGVYTDFSYIMHKTVIQRFAEKYKLEIPAYKYKDLCLPAKMESSDESMTINYIINRAIQNGETRILLDNIFSETGVKDRDHKYKIKVKSEKLLADREERGEIKSYICGKDGEPVASGNYSEYIIEY